MGRFSHCPELRSWSNPGKKVEKNHIEGPLGVRGRNSNNDLIREKLGWDYSMTLEEGISKTYNWIDDQLSAII